MSITITNNIIFKPFDLFKKFFNDDESRLIPANKLSFTITFNKNPIIIFNKKLYIFHISNDNANNESIIYKCKKIPEVTLELDLKNTLLIYNEYKINELSKQIYLKNQNEIYPNEFSDRMLKLNNEMDRILNLKNFILDLVQNKKNIDFKTKHIPENLNIDKYNNEINSFILSRTHIKQMKNSTIINLFNYVEKKLRIKLNINHTLLNDKIKLKDKKRVNYLERETTDLFIYYLFTLLIKNIDEYVDYLNICINTIKMENFYLCKNTFIFNDSISGIIESLEPNDKFSERYYFKDYNIYGMNYYNKKFTSVNGYLLCKSKKDNKWNVFPGFINKFETEKNKNPQSINIKSFKDLLDQLNEYDDLEEVENVINNQIINVCSDSF
jgi:hypothetical protein